MFVPSLSPDCKPGTAGKGPASYDQHGGSGIGGPGVWISLADDIDQIAVLDMLSERKFDIL